VKKQLIILAILLETVALGSAEEKKIWAKSFLNQKAPEFIVEKWLGPEPNRQGKFILVDFWATWCGPCRKAIPELNRIHKNFGEKLVVIGLSNEKEEVVRKMTDPQMTYFVAVDTQERLKRQVGVTGIPHVIIIDPKGIVRWEGFPLLPGFELTEAVVKQILGKYSEH